MNALKSDRRMSCFSAMLGARGYFVFLLAFLLVAPSAASAASLVAAVDRNTVPIGESITLTLTFEGATVNTPPTLPAIPNFQTGPSSGYRNEFRVENGVPTRKIIFQYDLRATQVGDTTIPAITVPTSGQTLTSQPIRVRVLNAATPAATAPNAAAGGQAFLRLVVPRTEVYLGEPFLLEIHLYFRSARDIRMPQLRAEGFAVSPPAEPTQSRTQVGNVQYNVAVFRLAGRAARTGTLTLGPAEEALTLYTRVDFFGTALDPRPVTLSTESVTMNVLPLPPGAPAGFNGTIGSYQLNVAAGPTSVAVGDPITVRVRIAGSGPLDALNYPDQTDWRDFNIYPPTAKVESADALGLSGAKSFEQVVIPQNHEIKNLPTFKFSFFDPQAKQYRTLTGPTIPLNIRPGSGSSTPPPVLTNANARSEGPREDDIIHIRPHFEPGAAAPPILTRPWFLALQVLPFLAWLGLWIRRRHLESLANNPRLRRQREVQRRIRAGLEELKIHSAAANSTEFFALLFRLLQEQLGERLDLPASAITESVIDEHLRARKLSPETLKSLQELFLICNQARYAPVHDRQELAAIIPRLESVCHELQELKT
jgi:hypothetical protein